MNRTPKSPTSIPEYQIIDQLFSSAKTVVYRALQAVDSQAVDSKPLEPQTVVIQLRKRAYSTFHGLLQLHNQYYDRQKPECTWNYLSS